MQKKEKNLEIESVIAIWQRLIVDFLKDFVLTLMLMILKEYGLYLMDDCEGVNVFGLNFEFEVTVNEEQEYSFSDSDTTLLPPSIPIMFVNYTLSAQL